MKAKFLSILKIILLFSFLVASAQIVNSQVEKVEIANTTVYKLSDQTITSPETTTTPSLWERIISFIKQIFNLQATLETKDDQYHGTVLDIGETNVLGPDNPSMLVKDALYIKRTYTDKLTGATLTCNDCGYGAKFDFIRGTMSENPDKTLVDKGTPKIISDASGYVTIDESSGIATWHKSTGTSHPKIDYAVTRYEIYIDRSGFGVTFPNTNPQMVVLGKEIKITALFDNKIAEGIGCGLEIKIAKKGFFTQEIINITPKQKCKLGMNEFKISVPTDELGIVDISTKALLYIPSYTRFSKERTGGMFIYHIDNETIVDDSSQGHLLQVVLPQTLTGIAGSTIFK